MQTEILRLMRQLAVLLLVSLSAFADSRSYEATYVATIAEIPARLASVDVWIPLPQTSEHQSIDGVTIEAPWKFTQLREDAWGNRYAHARIPEPPSTVVVRVRFNVTREEATIANPKGDDGARDRALRADRLVTLSPRIRKLADEVTTGRTTVMEQARAIYDHIVDTMTYDKLTPGWGLGDTERACDIRKGNCTDFHSLFMSLARAKGIPARFVIGFPTTATDGVVHGYHCWAEFYVDGKGWIPIDASDAAKNAKLHDYLFGNLDPERVQFTIGRDLTLTPPTSQPLNYFIQPHAESNGSPVGIATSSLEFRRTSGTLAAGAQSQAGGSVTAHQER